MPTGRCISHDVCPTAEIAGLGSTGRLGYPRSPGKGMAGDMTAPDDALYERAELGNGRCLRPKRWRSSLGVEIAEGECR